MQKDKVKIIQFQVVDRQAYSELWVLLSNGKLYRRSIREFRGEWPSDWSVFLEEAPKTRIEKETDEGGGC